MPRPARHFHERSSVTVTISMTGWPHAPGLRARNIICPAVSRNISTSEYSPGGGLKAWRTFASTASLKGAASVRFKAASPRESTLHTGLLYASTQNQQFVKVKDLLFRF